jgi:hypothetical protein
MICERHACYGSFSIPRSEAQNSSEKLLPSGMIPVSGQEIGAYTAIIQVIMMVEHTDCDIQTEFRL